LTAVDAWRRIEHIDIRQYQGGPVSRVQLALNVSDLDAAVAFYSTLFQAEPAKRRPGYANFAVADPPLKLVLLQSADPDTRGPGTVGALNHLGVEVSSTGEVGEASTRLAAAGLDTASEENTTCCYALQDKVWVTDPDGAPWEVYTVLADAPAELVTPGRAGDSACCGATATSEHRSASPPARLSSP
jgi:catechol 2,3-dioxygenase-like lactoylglutathione lyase family enzyme